ncbi:hypothetical protein [Oceanobacillus sp. CFH 90083]|uniref:hypothetical protein n=1 Tax=Oceanobacillus sp. CFH 90083 TaxID=2592336 RepID=UPI00128B1D60|nr:hypothetical protein [Oceanobacillus sp. CFH 90083]
MKKFGKTAFYIFFALIGFSIIVGPLMALRDIRDILQYETPVGSLYPMMICLGGFVMYLSLRLEGFRWIYQKWPILWPVLQMGFFMLIGIGLAATFLNSWAENNFPSKGIAITLGVISFIAARVLMSYWFHRFPASPAVVTRREL